MFFLPQIIIVIVYSFVKHFSKNPQQNLGRIAHNVPAVYDVLPARIRALRSKDQGLAKCGGVWAWE
jgi:hypothetical protein